MPEPHAASSGRQLISTFCKYMGRHQALDWSSDGDDILGSKKQSRRYVVTYSVDSKEREEAVAFFREGLFPTMNVPEALRYMSAEDAQNYLDAHPMQEKWSMLTLDSNISFVDEDLFRLKYLPELDRLHSHAEHLSDRGVSFLRLIPELRHLLIYSPLVTDACLQDIAALRHLQTIDLQGSHLVTRSAFDQLVASLPNLVDVYPPFDRPLSEVFAAAQK